MSNYTKNYLTKVEEKNIVNSVMTNVFTLMTLALAVTGTVSYYIMGNEELLIKLVSNSNLFLTICGAELLLVFVLSLAINKLSFSAAMIIFAIYSVINGVTLAPLMFMYTQESIIATFFITAATFGAMAVFGYTTKHELSGIGRILIMSLIGLIIASVVNLFLKNNMMESIINYAGVAIFIGLTAYDTQKIKNIVQENISNNDGISVPKIAVIGALTLYLDFINLFIKLLRIMGKRK